MNQNASTWLELPAGLTIDDRLQQALNERFRTIADRLDRASTSSAGGSAAADLSGRQLLLTVPGTLGERLDAAPRVSLAATATPVEIVALLKRTSQGASVKVRIQVAAVTWAALEIAAGGTQASLSTKSLGPIALNSLVTLDVTGVGTTFPGADLSLMLRF